LSRAVTAGVLQERCWAAELAEVLIQPVDKVLVGFAEVHARCLQAPVIRLAPIEEVQAGGYFGLIQAAIAQ
jgi:hypothetical protein